MKERFSTLNETLHGGIVVFAIVLIALVLMAVISNIAHAAPFLVCDPQAEVMSYTLEINGILFENIAAEADGSIKYDLAGTADGIYLVKAKAHNMWGESGWSVPFDLAVQRPGAPFGLRLSGP